MEGTFVGLVGGGGGGGGGVCWAKKKGKNQSESRTCSLPNNDMRINIWGSHGMVAEKRTTRKKP